MRMRINRKVLICVSGLVLLILGAFYYKFFSGEIKIRVATKSSSPEDKVDMYADIFQCDAVYRYVGTTMWPICGTGTGEGGSRARASTCSSMTPSIPWRRRRSPSTTGLRTTSAPLRQRTLWSAHHSSRWPMFQRMWISESRPSSRWWMARRSCSSVVWVPSNTSLSTAALPSIPLVSVRHL